MKIYLDGYYKVRGRVDCLPITYLYKLVCLLSYVSMTTVISKHGG